MMIKKDIKESKIQDQRPLFSPNFVHRTSILSPYSPFKALFVDSPHITLRSIAVINNLKKKKEITKQLIHKFSKESLELYNESRVFFKIVIKLLNKNFDQRTISEREIIKKILKKEELFQKIKENLGKEVFSRIFKEIKPIFFPKLKSIAFIGDEIKKCIMILEGEFLILKSDEQDKIEIKENYNEFIKKNYPNLYPYKILKKGDYVFLDAILNDKGNYQSSIVVLATENSNCLLIQKESIKKIKEEYNQFLLFEKLTFLKKFPMFSKWSKEALKVLLENCEIKILKSGSIIYRENDPIASIYLIKSGEIELSKLVEKDNDNELSPLNNIETAYNQSKQLELRDFEDINQIWANRKNQKNIKRITIAILGPNQFFGEEELLNSFANGRTCKAVVKSEITEFFSINKDNLFQLCKVYNSNELFKNVAKCKFDWRNQFLSKTNSQVKSFSNLMTLNSNRSLNQDAETELNMKNLSHSKEFNLGYFSAKTPGAIRGRLFSEKNNKENLNSREISEKINFQKDIKIRECLSARYEKNNPFEKHETKRNSFFNLMQCKNDIINNKEKEENLKKNNNRNISVQINKKIGIEDIEKNKLKIFSPSPTNKDRKYYKMTKDKTSMYKHEDFSSLLLAFQNSATTRLKKKDNENKEKIKMLKRLKIHKYFSIHEYLKNKL